MPRMSLLRLQENESQIADGQVKATLLRRGLDYLLQSCYLCIDRLGIGLGG
jgi:hypothetical protein